MPPLLCQNSLFVIAASNNSWTTGIVRVGFWQLPCPPAHRRDFANIRHLRPFRPDEPTRSHPKKWEYPEITTVPGRGRTLAHDRVFTHFFTALPQKPLLFSPGFSPVHQQRSQ